MFLAYIFHHLPFSILSVCIFTSFLYWWVAHKRPCRSGLLFPSAVTFPVPRTVGMNPQSLRFLCYTAVVLVPHIIGEPKELLPFF